MQTCDHVLLAALAHAPTKKNPAVIRLQSELQNLQAQLAQMESGTSKADVHGIPTSQVLGLELEYIRKKEREVKYHEALFSIIAKQYEGLILDAANSSPMLQALDEAIVPDMRSGPLRIVIMTAGFRIGLFGGSIRVLFHAPGKRSWDKIAYESLTESIPRFRLAS